MEHDKDIFIVNRLSLLDKKLIEYVNKKGYNCLEKKIKTKYLNMEEMYKKNNVHKTVILYIENLNIN